jgi:predicted nucleic acid-binding protein
MIAIDTNALIYRIFVEGEGSSSEISELTRHAKRKFAEIYAKKEKIAVPVPVLIEFANIIKRKFGRKKANEIVDSLIADTNFVFIESKEEYVGRAIAIAIELDGDFTDALISTSLFAHGVKKILTFDKDFEKYKEVEIVK